MHTKYIHDIMYLHSAVNGEITYPLCTHFEVYEFTNPILQTRRTSQNMLQLLSIDKFCFVPIPQVISEGRIFKHVKFFLVQPV